ncbi:P-loop ATPase, Sll1717 family [Mucilaginibacter sp. AK015]|uniref:P-loop ATPase, Sll1717 family n=1 Tax=Mucilaginibacter sp. AK015 TaxID=2723072 RepID=UPI0016188AF6|nr:hypothetical protein [Mucilaginibacter sp. AK015]MBB5397186.1 hypothetical protein [Mucilaginibacter sp. AK015]
MGSKKSQIIKKFKFTKYLEIGSPDAETDKLLDQAFIEKDALEALLDTTNQRSILIGRTGSGKSAILKNIESTQEKVTRIEPEAMSLRFLSNSTLLQYFRDNDVNLNFFYKILWKHVFVIELLRLYFSYDNKKKNNWFVNLKEKFIKKYNPKRDKAFEYFDKWSNEFWLDTEVRIKEIENTVQKRFENELGIDIKSARGKASTLENNQIVTKSDIKTKAEHIISDALAHDIHEIIKILQEELFVDNQQKHFVIIDDLDKEWIATDIRYDLIGAMIEVIKEFQVLKGVKIIISLRDNLYQLLFSGVNHKGGQREKFKPLYAELTWTAIELKEFLNKRLFLVTHNNLDIRSAFDRQYKNGTDGFMYMLDRTFYRPRDVISYVNHAIENANNRTHFTLDVLKRAEIDYSHDRLQAIEDEWGENYGELRRILRFLNGKHNGFSVKNIKEDDFTELYFEEMVNEYFHGDLLSWITQWKKGQLTFAQFLKHILFLLYQIGIIGIKKGTTYPIQFFYEKNVLLVMNDISLDSKIYIHKAFYAALKINTKELEPDKY